MRTLLAAVLLACPLLAAPVPKSVKRATPPLNGEWKVVEWHVDETRMQLTDNILWTIDGETLTVRGVRQAVPAGFAANATRTVTRPEGGADNAIDYVIEYTDGTPPSHRPAVIELDGDRLALCMASTHNGPRPAECKPTQGTIMYVLKRVDAAK